MVIGRKRPPDTTGAPAAQPAVRPEDTSYGSATGSPPHPHTQITSKDSGQMQGNTPGPGRQVTAQSQRKPAHSGDRPALSHKPRSRLEVSGAPWVKFLRLL